MEQQRQSTTLRDRREALEITQRDLAKRAGLHPETIGRAEVGIGPSRRSLRRIEAALSEIESESHSESGGSQ